MSIQLLIDRDFWVKAKLIRVLIWALYLVTTAHNDIMGQGVTHWKVENPYVSRTDAAFSFSADYGALISNRSIQYQPMVESFALEVLESIIPANIFPAMYNAKPISACLSADDQVFLAFKGNVYVPVNKADLSPVAAPQSWTGWPGYWKNDIDAALQWTDGSYVFIKGLQYVSYNRSTGATSPPAQLNKFAGWPSNWTGAIDAAFNGNDGYLYFIRKGEILAMDASTNAFAPGYPRPLSGQTGGINQYGSNAFTSANISQPGNAAGYDQSAFQQPVGAGSEFLDDYCPIGVPEFGAGTTYSETMQYKTCLKGGEDGEYFSEVLTRSNRIKEIKVWARTGIDGISVVTASPEGFITEHEARGKAIGSPEKFEFAPGECLIGLTGTWDEDDGELKTLRIRTNKRLSPVFGGLGGMKGDNEFDILIPPEGAFAGYQVRGSNQINAIGLIFNIYQHGAWGEKELIYDLGDKSDWTGCVELVGKLADGGPADPYFDDHVDVAETDALDNRFLYSIMPGLEAIGRSVDITKIDPWDLSKIDGRANRSPMVIMAAKENIGSGAQKWFFPHGYNANKSGQLSTGRSTNDVKIMASYKEYKEEFGIKIGAEFQVTGAAAGSANGAHKNRKTTAIGQTKVLISETYDISSHSCYVDLFWNDPKSDTKKRQLLNSSFRRLIDSLPVPSGTIPEIPITSMAHNEDLPSKIQRLKSDYAPVISEFGTHFMNNVQFGGYYTMFSEMEATEISKSKSTETDVKVAFSAGAAASPGGIQNSGGVTIVNNIQAGNDISDAPGATTVGGSLEVNSSSEQSETSKNSNMKVEIFATGGSGKITYAAWENDVKTDPIVRDAEFFPISDLLTEEFFPFDEEIEKKRKTLKLFIKQHIRNSAILLSHNEIDRIEFSTQADKDKAQTEMQQAANNKDIYLKIEFMKMNVDEGDGGSDPWLELVGHLKWAVIDDQLNNIDNGYIFNNPEHNKPYKVKKDNASNDLSVQKVIKTKMGKKDQLQLVIWGDVREEDPVLKDVDILKIESSDDGEPTSLPSVTQFGELSSIKDYVVTGEDGKNISFKFRVQWVERPQSQ